MSNTYLSGISCIVEGMSTSVRTFKKLTENDIMLPLAIYSFIHVCLVYLDYKVISTENLHRIKPFNLLSRYLYAWIFPITIRQEHRRYLYTQIAPILNVYLHTSKSRKKPNKTCYPPCFRVGKSVEVRCISTLSFLASPSLCKADTQASPMSLSAVDSSSCQTGHGIAGIQSLAVEFPITKCGVEQFWQKNCAIWHAPQGMLLWRTKLLDYITEISFHF